MEHQRQIIDTFVNSVYVFDDRVVLNFNFTDDSKTISREEVLGSSAVENAPPQSPDLSVWGLWWTVQGSSSNGDRCETVNFTPPEGILLLENMVYSAWFNKSEFEEIE